MGISNVDPNSRAALAELVVGIQDLAGNLASDSTLQQAIEELQNILLELTTKVNEDGTIHLGASDLSALESITSTVIGLPSDYPDAAAEASLAAIQGLLAGTITTLISNFPVDYPDTVTQDSLADILDTLVDVLGETGDNGTLLSDIKAGVLALPTASPLTDTQLRASSVPISLAHTSDAISLNAASSTALDTKDATWGSFQLFTASGAAVTIQQSNNGSTWLTTFTRRHDLITTSAWTTNSFSTLSLYVFPISGRYVRVTCAGGPITGQLELFATAPNNVVENALQAGTWTVQPGNSVNATPWSVGGKTPIASFTGRTTTGAGTALNCALSMANAHMVLTVNDTITSCTVNFEGSLDGVSWVTLGTTSITTGVASVVPVTPTPCRQFRANVAAITPGAGSITAWVGAA